MFQQITFLSGVEALKALKIMKKKGNGVIDYLLGFDCRECFEKTEDSVAGEEDNVLDFEDGYRLIWNPVKEYIGLEMFI